jgi:hypothetical protein
MTACEHHYCTMSCLYAGNNPAVISQHGDRINADSIYRGILCCKCHHLLLIPEPEKTPVEQNENCFENWARWRNAVDLWVATHGPLGG